MIRAASLVEHTANTYLKQSSSFDIRLEISLNSLYEFQKLRASLVTAIGILRHLKVRLKKSLQ